jgi:acetolactate synthase-1/3 small subunit
MHVMIVASARNTFQALNRVVSLLRGRDFHVESLAVARSEHSEVVRLTIVVDPTRTRAERVASCLEKLEEVWSVRRIEGSDVVQREMALIKFIEASVPGELVSAIVASHAARVIERSGGAAILEIVGPPGEVDHAIDSLPRAAILEIARPGQFAMARGHRQTTVATPPVLGSGYVR